jgi:radical SAM/Cys-rich protein
MATSLLHQQHPLAKASNQLRILENLGDGGGRAFAECLQRARLAPLRANGIQVLQLNLGKVCNQTCSHCHVDAGPDRRESMSLETADACLRALSSTSIPTLDITGGAPEMNPNFRWLVSETRSMGRHVIDRCNLTILTANGFEDLPEFLAEQRVEIVASLPCYLEANCDRQRGEGVFRRSIAALSRLNQLGYGQPGTGLTLTLVFNPVGPHLPPSQQGLEAAYREELRTRYCVEFTRLFTITNMPISRFLDELLRTGQYETYMQKLVDSFNPATIENLMCRTTLSVDWQGFLYDCDFNQMLELPVAKQAPRHIREFDSAKLQDRPIVTGQHCLGCTAGQGSSCQGTLVTG